MTEDPRYEKKFKKAADIYYIFLIIFRKMIKKIVITLKVPIYTNIYQCFNTKR